MSDRFDLVVSNGTVVTMAADGKVVPDGAVAVRGDTVVLVGKAEEVRRAGTPARRLDAGGGLILPGFVNAHTHLAMVLLRGLADDLPLREWLQQHIWPAEARLMSAEAVGLGTRWAAIESLKAGVTTACDMYFHSRAIADAVTEVGLRTVLSEGLVDSPTPACRTADESLARQRELLVEYRGHPLVVPSVAPHAPYSVSADLLRREAELALEFGAPFHIHVAETRWEDETIRARSGVSPVAYLDSLGVLCERTVAAHCVHVTEADMEVLASRRVCVVICPVSELKLGSGIAPLPAMLGHGLAVGLGSDGAASNNTLDVLREAQLAALLAKGVTGDPTVVPARTAMELLTIGGARALGLDRQIGSLETGKRADIVVMSLDAPPATPLHNPFSHLAYAARAADVQHVVVNGRLVMEHRTILTADEDALRHQVRRMATLA